MKSIFTYGSYTHNAAKEVLAKDGGICCIYQIDRLVPRELAQQGISCFSIKDLIKPADYDRVEDKCGEILKNFFRTEQGGDYSLWHGVSLGYGLCGNSSIAKVVPIICNALQTNKLLDREKVDRIYLGRGVGFLPMTWAVEAQKRGMEVVWLESDPPVKVEPEWSREAIRQKEGDIGQATNLFARFVGASLYRLENAKRKAVRAIARTAQKIMGRRSVLILQSPRRAEKELSLLGVERILEDPRVKLSFCPDNFGREPGAWKWEQYVSEQRTRWTLLKNELETSDLFYLDGYNLWEHFESYLEKLFVEEIAKYVFEFEAAESHIKFLNPDMMLTRLNWADHRFPWCLAADVLGVKILAIQREYFNSSRSLFYYPRPTADWIFSIGPENSRWFREHGCNDARLLETGKPNRFDVAEKVDKEDRNKLRRRLGLDRKPVVLFVDAHYCGTSINDQPLLTWEKLQHIKRVAAELSSAQFVVKFHPSHSHFEGDDHIQRRVDFLSFDMPANLKLAPLNTTSVEALALADVLVTDTSTMGVEAMMVNLPLVFLRDVAGGFRILDYSAPPPAALYAGNEDELSSVLESILTDIEKIKKRLKPGQDRLLARMIVPRQESSKIVAELCLEN